MLLPILSLLLAPLTSTGDALGIAANGSVYTVDTVAGSTTFVGNCGYAVHALARDANGVFWTVGDGANDLVRIDPQTGAGTSVATLSLSSSVRGMAFEHDGSLFLVVSPGPGLECKLEQVDMNTFAVTAIGSTLLPDIEGMCRIPEQINGHMFLGWDVGPGGSNGHGLVTLSQNSGIFSDLHAAGGDNSILALAIDPVGRCIGVGRRLYRVDRLTGVSSPISGDLGVALVGLEFLDAMTTENSALAIEADGDLLRVNSTTGATLQFANAGASGFVAMTKAAGFSRYYAIRDLGATSEVSTIDPLTGSRNVVATIALDDVRAAASLIHPFLRLIQDGGPGGGDWLYTFNAVTLALTLDAQIPSLKEVEAMSIDVNGKCIVSDSTAGLALLENNGFTTDLVAGDNPMGLRTLAHDDFGRLFATNSGLLRVGIPTEALTPIGSSAFADVVGFDFMSTKYHGNASTYCVAQTNSAGCVPFISLNTVFNVPSVSAGVGFPIRCFQVLKNKPGLFFYGRTGRENVPFLGGTLCAKPPVKRTPGQNSGGLSTCGGTFVLDFNTYMASGADPALVPGVTVNGQWWSRDALAPSGSNLSNAVEFEVCP